MPIHHWTRVDAGLFHDFHQDWIIELRRSLNAGLLPPGHVALTDESCWSHRHVSRRARIGC